jgi:hypothetical protein
MILQARPNISGVQSKKACDKDDDYDDADDVENVHGVTPSETCALSV